jgi:hypothetical protein
MDLTVGLPRGIEHPIVRNSGLAAAVQDGRIKFAAAA